MMLFVLAMAMAKGIDVLVSVGIKQVLKLKKYIYLILLENMQYVYSIHYLGVRCLLPYG